jgi:peptide/nickel transport system ATP-binding protein
VSAFLDIEGLVVEFPQPGWRTPPLRAVDGVDLTVNEGETVGLVGESGSGKSTIGRAVLGLVKPAAGTIRFDGKDITNLPRDKRRQLATDLQVVFQDPYSSLNPALTIGKILTEPLEVQRRLSGREADETVRDLLERVKLPADAASRYPNRFSGGQRQRIAIARALAISPRLVVCDEPVSALDLSTQAQVLNLLSELQTELGLAYLFVAHDLAVVRHFSRRIVVLYRGRVMEQGPAEDVYERPLHPYTRALLAAAPVPNPGLQRERRLARAATAVPTTAAAKSAPMDGCPFAPRCPFASDVCWSKRPADDRVGHSVVACHMYDPASGHPRAGQGAPEYAPVLTHTMTAGSAIGQSAQG